MASSATLKAAGLITQPNQLEVPDGALTIASNVIIKRDNVLESRRGLKLYGDSFGTQDDRAKQLANYKNRILRHFASTLQFDNGSGTFTSFNGNFSEVSSGVRIKSVESNGNFYFTTSDGIKKISAKTASQLSSASGYITNAGGVKALDVNASLNIEAGGSTGFLPADSAVAYRIVWGIKDANGNLVLGTPSQRAEIYNPLSSLIAQDLNRILKAIDDASAASSADALSDTDYMSTLAVGYNADGSSLKTAIISLVSKLDTDIVLNTGNATINAEVITTNTARVRVTNSVATLISAGDHIQLSGFTAGGLTQLNSKSFSVTSITTSGPNFDLNLTYLGTDPLTIQASTPAVNGIINSYNYTYITTTASADFTTPLADLTIDTPATNNELGTIQDTLSRILTRLQNELSGVIASAAITTYLDPIELTNAVNINLEFTIPDQITTSHFYQIYRSATVQATGTTVLSDLVPSDELQQVYEAFPTDAELAAQFIQVEDVTPDAFRGANLYTNASTGEGILQSNDVPPAALDINRFKGYTFFANTRTRHRLTFNFLGVQQLIDLYNSGIIPTITIGNNDNVATFTFVTGLEEITNITCIADTANSLNGKYFTLNSASDIHQYYFWFKTSGGATSDPAVSGRTGVRIDIVTGSSANTVAGKVRDAVNSVNIDFSAINNTLPTIKVSNIDEGSCTDATAGTSGFTVAVSQQGRGEDLTNNQVLLSQLTSVARATDATARSFVKAVNRSTGSAQAPIYAFYLSGASDVPGKILLESRNLDTTDNPFYIVTNSAQVSATFNPNISPAESVNAGVSILKDSPSSGHVAFNVTGHGLENEDRIIISGTKNASPSLNLDGIYYVTKQSANQFSITASIAANSTVTAGSIGLTYLPDAKVSDNEAKANRLYYSKFQQPEAVPVVNTIDIGAEDKAILRIFPLRDSLFIFKEDGLYRVSGEISPFTQALFDGSCILIAGDSLGLSNNFIYGWTKKGIETLNESGAEVISRSIDIDILPKPSVFSEFQSLTWGVGYESDNSYIVFTIQDSTDEEATIAYRYSNLTGTWTTFDHSATCGIINAADDRLYVGAGDTNYIEQERKNFDRTDYSDRELAKAITSSSLLSGGYKLKFSDISDFEVGDVVTQEQYLTIYEFNALLQKLDIDPGVNDSNYYSTLKAVSGDSLRSKLSLLAAKLDADSGLVFSDYASRITADGGSYSTSISSIDIANPTHINTAASHGLWSITAPSEGRWVTISGTDTNATVNGTYQITRIDSDSFSIGSNVISVTDGIGSFAREELDFRDIKACYNLTVEHLNADDGASFANYSRSNTTTLQEGVITEVDNVAKTVTLNIALDFIVGPLTLYKHISTVIQYAPHTMGDPLGFKHLREATAMFESKAFTSATMSFATDLLPRFIDVDFNADGSGLFGNNSAFGSGFFGGASNSAPFRTYIPRECQRCRYIVVKFSHAVAREKYSLYGITLTGEGGLSSRAYR